MSEQHKSVDTRNKILNWPQAEQILRQSCSNGSARKVVAGYFDPLLASHARRLGEIAGPGGRLVVLIDNPAHPILPVWARAELVAALSVVDYVVLPAEGDGPTFLEQIPAGFVLREEAADERRRTDLVERVHRRQKADRD